MREAATSPLKDRAVFQNLRDPIALQWLTWLFLPAIREKRMTVDFRDGRCDALLQPQQVLAHGSGVGVAHRCKAR